MTTHSHHSKNTQGGPQPRVREGAVLLVSCAVCSQSLPRTKKRAQKNTQDGRSGRHRHNRRLVRQRWQTRAEVEREGGIEGALHRTVPDPAYARVQTWKRGALQSRIPYIKQRHYTCKCKISRERQ